MSDFMFVCLICGEPKVELFCGHHDERARVFECSNCYSQFRFPNSDGVDEDNPPNFHYTEGGLTDMYEQKVALLHLGKCVWKTSNLTKEEKSIRNLLEKLEKRNTHVV